MPRAAQTETPMEMQVEGEKIPSDLLRFVAGVQEEVAGLRAELSALRDELAEQTSLLNRYEAAEELNVSVRTLDTMEAAGEIEAIRPNGEGGRVLYPPQSLELYIERQLARGERRP